MGWFDGNMTKPKKDDATLEKDLKGKEVYKIETIMLSEEERLALTNESLAHQPETETLLIDNEKLSVYIDDLVKKKEESVVREEDVEQDCIETSMEKEELKTIKKNILALKPDEVEVVVEVPIESLEKLINTKGMVPLSIHGNSLLLNVNEIDELLGEGTLTDARLKILQKSLETALSKEDSLELADKQRQSISSGVKFSLEEHNPILSLSSYKVIVPEFISKVQVEELDKEVELSDYSVLVEVKPEYQEEALGLPKVITTSVAVKILNDVSKLSIEEEFKFYCQLLPHMKSDSHTVQYALNLLRMIMQYSINVDTLELKAVLTREVLKHGE